MGCLLAALSIPAEITLLHGGISRERGNGLITNVHRDMRAAFSLSFSSTRTDLGKRHSQPRQARFDDVLEIELSFSIRDDSFPSIIFVMKIPFDSSRSQREEQERIGDI